jgi:hypothetical protein
MDYIAPVMFGVIIVGMYIETQIKAAVARYNDNREREGKV